MSDNIPTKSQYDAASPWMKGYMSYMYAEHPGSTIPKTCPFEKGTQNVRDFERGQAAAVLDAQDSEE